MDMAIINSAQTQVDRCEPYQWLGRVLTNFAKAEQAIGNLCVELNLPVERGPLSNLQDLRIKLTKIDDKRCKTLISRIDRWASLRPFRHLLAHATIHQLSDTSGAPIIVTRHLPRDRDDVTPDRMWTAAEREDLLAKTRKDSSSISDQIRNLMADKAVILKLRSH